MGKARCEFDWGPALLAVAGHRERWSDGSLRPAPEDAVGAGAVLSQLQEAGCQLSAEAVVTATFYRSANDVSQAVHEKQLLLDQRMRLSRHRRSRQRRSPPSLRSSLDLSRLLSSKTGLPSRFRHPAPRGLVSEIAS